MSKESYAKKRAMETFDKMNVELPSPLYIPGDGKHIFIQKIIHAIVEDTIAIERTGHPKPKCYCGKPVDINNPDCVEFNLCEEHADDA
jgi:hypothetical protein